MDFIVYFIVFLLMGGVGVYFAAMALGSAYVQVALGGAMDKESWIVFSLFSVLSLLFLCGAYHVCPFAVVTA